VAGRDLTDGRANRSIAVDVGVVSSTSLWQNTDVAYDVAVGGLPFFYAISDARPYIRQTAPFRKEQSDIGAEPGEQSGYGEFVGSVDPDQRAKLMGGAIATFAPTLYVEPFGNVVIESQACDFLL
jgi:glycosyltransferase involved in cell wall biosynthesis